MVSNLSKALDEETNALKAVLKTKESVDAVDGRPGFDGIQK